MNNKSLSEPEDSEDQDQARPASPTAAGKRSRCGHWTVSRARRRDTARRNHGRPRCSNENSCGVRARHADDGVRSRPCRDVMGRVQACSSLKRRRTALLTCSSSDARRRSSRAKWRVDTCRMRSVASTASASPAATASTCKIKQKKSEIGPAIEWLGMKWFSNRPRP